MTNRAHWNKTIGNLICTVPYIGLLFCYYIGNERKVQFRRGLIYVCTIYFLCAYVPYRSIALREFK